MGVSNWHWKTSCCSTSLNYLKGTFLEILWLVAQLWNCLEFWNNYSDIRKTLLSQLFESTQISPMSMWHCKSQRTCLVIWWVVKMYSIPLQRCLYICSDTVMLNKSIEESESSKLQVILAFQDFCHAKWRFVKKGCWDFFILDYLAKL